MVLLCARGSLQGRVKTTEMRAKSLKTMGTESLISARISHYLWRGDAGVDCGVRWPWLAQDVVHERQKQVDRIPSLLPQPHVGPEFKTQWSGNRRIWKTWERARQTPKIEHPPPPRREGRPNPMNENNVHIDRHCKHQKQKYCRISCPTDKKRDRNEPLTRGSSGVLLPALCQARATRKSV